MNILIIRLASLLSSGLIAGILFGIWVGYNPKNLSAQTYVEQQQSVIKAMNTFMPLMGLVTIAITLTAAFMQKEKLSNFTTLLFAAGLLILSGLLTRFGNQPINSVMLTWDKLDPPANWVELRDRWWNLHTIRMLSAFIAFCLISCSSIRKV
ncbi:anthrone oxygenase family protein [Pedobacter sp. NJ-S-72]